MQGSKFYLPYHRWPIILTQLCYNNNNHRICIKDITLWLITENSATPYLHWQFLLFCSCLFIYFYLPSITCKNNTNLINLNWSKHFDSGVTKNIQVQTIISFWLQTQSGNKIWIIFIKLVKFKCWGYKKNYIQVIRKNIVT